MNLKKYIIILFLPIILLSACTQEEDDKKAVKMEEVSLVEVENLNNYRSLNNTLSYFATVQAEAEANIYAKVSGTMIEQNARLGDSVKLGDVLASLDSASNLNLNSSQINSLQIRQAQVSLSQAQQAYNNALNSYDNLVKSLAKDIRQAELSLEQAKTGQTNLDLNIDENIKSAQIAYQSAQESSLQAKNNLENRKEQLNKSLSDLEQNIAISIDSSLDTINTILVNINNITAFDDSNVVNIAYKNNLGALDSSVLIKSKNLYTQVKNEINKSEEKDLADVIELSYLLKDLSDSVKLLFNKTITSSNLSQIELSSLQSQASSFQAQSSALLNSLTSQKQAKENLLLEIDSSLEALNSTYQLALKQEATAKQNLNNLNASNLSQSDQASLSVLLAENQLDNLRAKGETQLDNARSQIKITKLQYDNALLALESLYDNYTLISPLSGQLSLVNFGVGDTVSAGSLIFRISQTENLKLVFFVDSSVVNDLKLGQEVLVDNFYKAYISNIAPQADKESRKFQLEAKFNDPVDITVNKIVDLEINFSRTTSSTNQYYLPLPALFINQTETYLYTIGEQNRVKKININILEIIGETAKVEVLDDEIDSIIIENNKRIREGQLVEIK
jgi:multidrug efflux pump subunit AcrA (membrane-fusion protein)